LKSLILIRNRNKVLRSSPLSTMYAEEVSSVSLEVNRVQNTTFYQYSADNNYVYDQRGFNTFIKGLAFTYLKKNDSRLLLNTVVTNITYTQDGVTIDNKDGSCIDADYAICTFSYVSPESVDLSQLTHQKVLEYFKMML